MKLYEFFGRINIDTNQENGRDPDKPTQEEEQELEDRVFWYILDHDDLHKKYFMPIAKKLKKIYDTESKEDDLHDWKQWQHMVNSGCADFYKENDIPGDPRDVFSKKFRTAICKRLTDHYRKDIIKGEYKLGR